MKTNLEMKMTAASFVLFVILARSSLTSTGALRKKRDVFGSNELKEGEDVMTRIAVVNEESDVELFESDIKLPNDSKVNNDQERLTKRNAYRARKALWREKKVPYRISAELLTSWYRPTILKAIGEFHKHTCVQFIPHTTESKWIDFVKERGCWSFIGRTHWWPGGQRLSLGNGCNITATVIHELLHALGFWHEQSRPDRNQYVEIIWENIVQGKEHNFQKYNHFAVDNQEKPYDFQSIMHYGNKYFSKNGLDTIRAITQPDLKLGQRNGFSQIDIDEVNKLYDCSNPSPGWSSWSSFTPCDLQCNKTRERFCSSSNAAQDCPGASSLGVQQETAVCGVLECSVPVHGHWGRWSSWGICSSHCGPGTRSRSRVCNDPPPANGGKNCTGGDKEEHSCVFQSCGLGPIDCEFEVDELCHWTQDSTDDLDWIRRQGPTPSSRTGPDGDHTSGGGYYLYVEASAPVVKGQKARLISGNFPGSNLTICLIFAFSMYGSGMGALNVYLDSSAVRSLLLSEFGDHGNSWKTVHVDFESSKSYQIIIEAVRGDTFRSDIAIDDIVFIPGSCSAIPVRNVGCYNDKTRPLETFYETFRDQIDWFDMKKTVKQCAKEAKNKGYKVFGVEFYGECWSSVRAKQVYNKDGVSTNCWNGVGKDYAFQAYELL